MESVRTTVFVILALASLSVLAAVNAAAAAEPAGFRLVAENEHLQLLLNEDTTEFAVANKSSRQIWYSNPPDRAQKERIATTALKERMSSQFSISYYTPIDTVNQMNSYTDSVKHGQFAVSEIENGVRIDYTLGKKWTDDQLLPLMVREDRFEELILDRIEGVKDRELILGKYYLISLEDMEPGDVHPQVPDFNPEKVFGNYKLTIHNLGKDPTQTDIKDMIVLLTKWLTGTRADLNSRRDVTRDDVAQLIHSPTYILTDKLGWDRPDILRILKEAGYTPEDNQVDAAENCLGVPQPNPVTFDIPVAYYLDGRDFVAEIIAEEIRYPVGLLDSLGKPVDYPLYEISFLEYFGAAYLDEAGYMLVPDGSGALIYLNNGKIHLDDYNDPIYGSDESVGSQERRSYYSKEQAVLPVFGMVRNHQGFVALIEQGDAFGSVRAIVSRKYNSYNSINAAFTILPKGVIQISSGFAWRKDANDYRTSINSYQSVPNTELIRVRYMFLDGGDATYSGMARRYQEYLVERYNLTRVAPREGIPLIIELIGGVHARKPILGLPREVMIPLTTFRGAQTIIDEIRRSSNAGSIVLRYSGWLDGGLYHVFPDRVRLEGTLGSRKDFMDLVAYVIGEGIDFYPNVDFVHVYRNSVFDRFIARSHAARTLDKKISAVYDYDLVNNTLKRDTLRYILSPLQLRDLMTSFGKDLVSYGIDGVSLESIGLHLHSDLRDDPEKTVERFEAKSIVVNGLREMKQTVGRVMISGGNAYTLPYADVLVNAPSTSGYNLTDKEYRFFRWSSMGIDYAGDPLNFSHDRRHGLLKAVETGAYPYFTLMRKIQFSRTPTSPSCCR